MKSRLKSILRMFDSDRLTEVTSTLAGNKSRTMLTAFGIFWGVFMLMLLLGGGKGLQQLIMSSFSDFATNSGIFYTFNTSKPYKGYSKTRSWRLTIDDVQGIRQRFSQIDAISPVITNSGAKAAIGVNKYDNAFVEGIYPDFFKIQSKKPKYGRLINEEDIRQHRHVCMLEKRVYESLFPKGGDPCGKFVSVDGVYYQIVGVDFNKSNISIGPPGACVFIPYSVARQVYNRGNTVNLIAFVLKRGYSVGAIEDPLRQYIYRVHEIAPDDRGAMRFLNVETFFQMFDNLFNGISFLVWLIGVGTLLSGLIGVTNIMLVSIRERTVEIGIRRAIGARPADIMAQIFAESEIMTFLAGMSGIVAAVGVLAVAEGVIQKAAETTAQFQVQFGMAVVTACALLVFGALDGVFPAIRAMAIKPVDAMRDE